MHDPRLWLVVVALLPGAVTGASFLRIDVERLRRLAVVAAAAMLAMALGVAAAPGVHALSIRTSALSWVPGGEALIRIDPLSVVLLPFAAGLWLLTVAVTPRAALDRAGLRRTVVATSITLATFLTESAVALLVLWAASVWTFVAALSDPAPSASSIPSASASPAQPSPPLSSSAPAAKPIVVKKPVAPPPAAASTASTPATANPTSSSPSPPKSAPTASNRALVDRK